MSEAKMLMFSGAAMFIVSFLTAYVLFVLNTGPIAVMFGGTIAGIAVYVALCVYSARIHKPQPQTEE